MTEKTEQTKPTVHNNGTGAQSLYDGYGAARAALRTAQEALRATYPNGRDYYTQGPGALRAAQEEHMARHQRLATTLDEIFALQLHVADRL
jgi:hypothetical protein